MTYNEVNKNASVIFNMLYCKDNGFYSFRTLPYLLMAICSIEKADDTVYRFCDDLNLILITQNYELKLSTQNLRHVRKVEYYQNPSV